MINWQYYPKSHELPAELNNIIEVFNNNNESIDSTKKKLSSDSVLAVIRQDLIDLGFEVEKGKRATDKIKVLYFLVEMGNLKSTLKLMLIMKIVMLYWK